MPRPSPLRSICALLPLALPFAVHGADEFEFDPDGAGPDSSITVSSFDWIPGSAVSLDSVPLATGTVTTLLTHSKLGNLLNSAGKPILGTGLNSDYELTFVSGGGLVATVYGTVAVFSFDPNNNTNFFEVYWDGAKDSNALAGTGFNNGTPILRGIVSAASSNFSTFGSPQTFDQYVNDDFHINTVTGTGSSTILVDVTFADPQFFPDPARQPKTLSFNTQQGTPYHQTNPSRVFVGAPGGAAPGVSPVLGAVNGLDGTDFQFQADANMSLTLEEIILGACRMTGGGVTEDGEIILPKEDGTNGAMAQDISDKNQYTFGGQIGAPTASGESPAGEWTHHQFKGPAGDFVFRVGTASAPENTKVTEVTCSDPGSCDPARPAPFKQLDWTGIGSFRNGKGALASSVNTENDSKAGYSIHYVRVHIEDLGEPGPGGKQPHSADCPHTIGEIVGDPGSNTDAALICSACADVYQIEIHASDDPYSAVIYSVGGFIDNGNLQIHPATP